MASDWSAFLACLIGCGGVGSDCLGPKTFGVPTVVVGKGSHVGDASIGLNDHSVLLLGLHPALGHGDKPFSQN